VKFHRGTQFRIWATQRLSEYNVKGFTMDDERLKLAGGGNYFDELLERIRDIRSSEKVFWRKVVEIYATSIDYDPSADTSKRFFATVQNKMHWAVHGQTADEVVVARADASKPNMGLMTWVGDRPRKGDAAIAKNYLSEDELAALNRIVMAYLEFAELRALDRKPMYMADWIRKLDDFLKLSEREILTHAGNISHDEAVTKAELEYDRFAEQRRALPAPVEKHLEEAVHDVKLLDKQRPAAPMSKSKTGGASVLARRSGRDRWPPRARPVPQVAVQGALPQALSPDLWCPPNRVKSTCQLHVPLGGYGGALLHGFRRNQNRPILRCGSPLSVK